MLNRKLNGWDSENSDSNMGSGYKGAEPVYGYESRKERSRSSYGGYDYPSSTRSTVHLHDSDYEYNAPKGNSSNYIVDFEMPMAKVFKDCI